MLELILPKLTVTPSGSQATTQDHAVPRAVLESMRQRFLDDRLIRESWQEAAYFERMSYLDYGKQFLGRGAAIMGPGVGSGMALIDQVALVRSLFSPLLTLDISTSLSVGQRLCDAGHAPDWWSAEAILDLVAPPDSLSKTLTRPLSSTLLPSYGSSVRFVFRSLAMRRMAAMAIAIRLYEIDHGRRPETLDPLVPEYLAEIPKDPFAADGSPLRYLPDAEPPVLYSVGTDGVDDAGRFVVSGAGYVVGDQADLVFFLDGGRPVPPMKVRPPESDPSEAK